MQRIVLALFCLTDLKVTALPRRLSVTNFLSISKSEVFTLGGLQPRSHVHAGGWGDDAQGRALVKDGAHAAGAERKAIHAAARVAHQPVARVGLLLVLVLLWRALAVALLLLLPPPSSSSSS